MRVTESIGCLTTSSGELAAPLSELSLTSGLLAGPRGDVEARRGEMAGLPGDLSMCLARVTASLSVVARRPRYVAWTRAQLDTPRDKIADRSDRLTKRLGEVGDEPSQVTKCRCVLTNGSSQLTNSSSDMSEMYDLLTTPCELLGDCQSRRSASTGSMRAARRAGITAASREAAISAADTTTNVAISVGSMP